MRVTHCPVNTAGIPWTNVQALRRKGVDAQLVVFERYRLHPEADAGIERSGGFARRQLQQARAFARLAPRTDVFHFYFGLTLIPKSIQFPLLRALGKKSVMHFLGSDIRGRRPEELDWSRRAGARIVGSYDATRWVPDAHVIPPGVDLSKIDPVPPPDRERPLVVHAPSSRRRKGTEDVIAACAQLPVDLEIVEGLRHDEAVRRTEEAFGVAVPVVPATKGSLAERLRPLVEDTEERRRVGAASRAYVERVHDADAVADRLLDVYARL